MIYFEKLPLNTKMTPLLKEAQKKFELRLTEIVNRVATQYVFLALLTQNYSNCQKLFSGINASLSLPLPDVLIQIIYQQLDDKSKKVLSTVNKTMRKIVLSAHKCLIIQPPLMFFKSVPDNLLVNLINSYSNINHIKFKMFSDSIRINKQILTFINYLNCQSEHPLKRIKKITMHANDFLNMPDLSDLNFSLLKALNHSEVESISINTRNTKESTPPSLTNDKLQFILDKFLQLKKFKLIGFHSSGETEKLLKDSKLKTLILEDSKFKDSNMKKILMNTCPWKLTKLEINTKNYNPDAFILSDEDLNTILHQQPTLEALSINLNVGITEKGLTLLGSNCPNLQHLNLIYPTITDQQLVQLVMFLPKLRSFKLKNKLAITEKGIDTIAKNCPHLKILSITKIEEIKKGGFESLIKHCPELEALGIESCIFEDLVYFAQHMPHLKCFKVKKFAFPFTQMQKETLHQKFPKLTVYCISSYQNDAMNDLTNSLFNLLQQTIRRLNP